MKKNVVLGKEEENIVKDELEFHMDDMFISIIFSSFKKNLMKARKNKIEKDSVKKDKNKDKKKDKTIDKLVKDLRKFLRKKLKNLEYGFIMEKQKRLDYAELFRYLGAGVKKYASYAVEEIKVEKWEDPEQDEDFFNPKFTDRSIYQIIRAAKIRNLYGVEVYINPMKKSMFDDWKMGNVAINRVLYDMVNI